MLRCCNHRFAHYNSWSICIIMQNSIFLFLKVSFFAITFLFTIQSCSFLIHKDYFFIRFSEIYSLISEIYSLIIIYTFLILQIFQFIHPQKETFTLENIQTKEGRIFISPSKSANNVSMIKRTRHMVLCVMQFMSMNRLTWHVVLCVLKSVSLSKLFR